MQIANRTSLRPEVFAELCGELPAFGTLHEIVIWGGKRRPPVLLLETVAQDEYTHDVIATFQTGRDKELFLVFGST